MVAYDEGGKLAMLWPTPVEPNMRQVGNLLPAAFMQTESEGDASPYYHNFGGGVALVLWTMFLLGKWDPLLGGCTSTPLVNVGPSHCG